MPDFDKDLNPILLNTDTSPLDLPNPATPIPHSYADLGGGRGAQGSATDGFFGNGPVVSNMLPTVTAKELYENRRYGTYSSDIIDLEDQKAYAQSGWDKAANGVLKGLNLAGTTVAGSFGMLLGAAKAPFSGRLADIWDNPVMRELDEWNNEVDQVYLPNYYTNAEKNATWYSTDNWFKTNWLFDKLIKNSGFAVGAMFSGNIANAGLLRAGASLGRAAAAGATAAESSQAFKLFTPLLRNTARAFSAGKNIEAAAILEKELSSIADITAKSSKLAEIAKQTNKFANIGNTGRRTLIAAYSSAGESSFEALQTANQYRDGLIEDYKSKHGGLDPVGADLDNINEMSEKVGKTSFFGNLALLSVTEYVQLPKLLGSSYSSSRQAANSLLGRTDDVLMKDGKYIATPKSTTKFGKVYDKVTGVGKYVFDPKEAAQELGQYALQVGTNNYFNKAYQTNAADEWVDGFLYGFVGKGEDGEGVGAFVSKEGMESAVMGGLTGGLMQAKGTFQEDRATKNNTQKFLSQINSAPSFQKAFQDRMAAINRGVVLQQQQQDAVIQGDKLEAKDLDADMMHNYLAPRIKYGRYDMIADDIADLKSQVVTEQGLASLKEQGIANINDTVESYMARLSLFENTAKNMDELYKSLNLRYGGEVDGEGRRLFTDDVIDKMVYAATKVADYDLRIPQVGENLVNSGVVIQDALKASIEGTSEEVKKSEADVLSQIDGLSSLNKDELKLDFFEVRELNARRKKFLDEYTDIKDKPAEYREAEAVPDQPTDEGSEATKIKVKTKAGDLDLEVGTEYFLGNVVKEDEKGNEVYGFPRLTVIGENENGTIKIKDSNGKLHDITKAELAKFKLGKVSSTLANKKAKYYLENINSVFEFNFGKGKKVKGRLQFSPKEGILEFVYKNKKGEIKTIEVTGDQFVARDGFPNPMITKIGELTAAEKQLTEQFAAEQDVRKVDKRAARLSILNSLFDEISGNQKKIDNLLKQKKNELDTITKELDTLKKNIASGAVSFKSTANDSIKAANRLSRMQEQLRLEIENLEAENNEAETTLEWISDLAQNIDELPTDSKEFLQELKDQRSALEDLILENGKSINALSDLMNRAEDALESAIGLLRRWINQFEKAYPKVPTNLGQEWVDFIKANPNFLKLAPKYKEDLAMLEDMVAQIEEFTIKPTEEDIAQLREDLEKLQDSLKEAEQQLKIKNVVISKFEQVAKEYQAQKEQEARILKNEALIAEVLGSADPGLQTRAYDSTYEPNSKKADVSVVTGTKVPSKSNQPHVKRANLFGINLPKLKEKDRDKIKGVVVSVKNEADYGLSGLMQHLKDVSDVSEAEKAKIDPSKTVALVMVVETKSGSYVPVDVNGNPLEDVSVETAIYQVFPEPNLEWSEQYGGGSMFRKETPQERIDYYKAEYGKWHQEMLDNPSNVPHKIQASFGIPKIPTRIDEAGNEVKLYDTRTSTVDAGLINESDLQTAPVIYVPTTNNVVSKGSTFFDSPLGRPFLSLANAYVKLMNRKLTKNEASTIYDAIYQLSLDVNENGNIKSDKSKRLINWLRSVIYWGTPKNATGYNSVFFDRTEEGLKIFFSGKGKSYFFTPQTIQDNKGEILAILEEMYNNVNTGLTNKDNVWDQPYEEIIGFEKDGTPIVREVDGNPYWPNYQTYLLSGKGRKAEEIPLTTQIRPLEGENDVNRDGVYFTLTDTADTERYNKPPKVGGLTPVVAGATPTVPAAAAPVTPVAPATPVVTAKATGDYKFDGSEETIAIVDKVGNSSGDAKFTVNLDEYEKSNGEKGFDIEALPDTIKALMNKKSLSETDARNAINVYVKSKIEPLVKERIAAKNAPAPAPTAPVVSDIEANQLTVEEADWLYNNIKQITDKYNSSTLADSADPNLKTPLKFGDTTVTAIEPRAGDKSYIWFERPTGKWLISIDERDGKQYLTLSKFNDKGTYYAQSISEEELQKLVDTSGLRSLIDSIYKDTNIKQPETRRDQFEAQNALQQKYGLKRTYKDIVKELAALTQPSVPVVSDTRADIERRRQEALNEDVSKVKGPVRSNYLRQQKEGEGVRSGTEIGDWVAFAKEAFDEDTKSTEVVVISGKTKQEVIDKVNAKYDAELAALEGTKPTTAAPTTVAATPASPSATPSAADMALIRQQMRNISPKTPLRKKIQQEMENFKPENWSKVEKWLKTKFPNIPVYRVKNVIQATNGQQAWGMFKDGALYIYENAEVGTVYHEVFHAVWRMFSDPVEQASVIAEVRSRPGMENATEPEIEELLAEEFRDYVQFKKIPGKPAKGRPYIFKLFSDLVNFIKGLFTSRDAKSSTKELFDKIGTGYYAKHSPYHASLAFAKEGIIDIEEAYASDDSAFRIKDISADKVHSIMQQMTYTTLTDLIQSNKSLFTIPKLKGPNKTKLYERLLEDMQQTVLQSAKAAEALVEQGKYTEAQAQPFYDSAFALWKSITDNWEDIKAKHEEYLKTYDIEFDENDDVQLNSDERSKESGWFDATKIDAFKKANGAIKLLLSTIPIVDNNNDFVYSPINGATLLPTSQVYMSLMNNLHTSRTIDEMMDRLRDMAKNDPNYRTLYSRLTNTPYTSNTLDLSDISEVHDGQMLAAFWRTFKKQNPDVKNVYIFENGDIEVGDASLSSAARQVANEYVENFKEVLTNPNPYFTYSTERKAYVGKPEGIVDVKESFKKSKSDSELLDKMISFLKTIGIEFKKEEIVKLPGDKQESFKASVNGVIASIEKAKNIATISGKVLDLQGRFMGLSTIRALINNPEFDSTFFNVKGERVQSFLGTNLPSDLFDVLSQIDNKEQLVGTPFEYLLTDELSQGSIILDKMFNKETGERKALTTEIMKPGYVDGTINQQNGKKKESSKLTYKERLVQEINMNLKGFYYNLVPGDASIEWMLYMTNHVTPDNLLSGFGRVNEIFKGYFLSELALSRSNRKIVAMEGRKSTDLRFFKPILGEELHNDIIAETGTPEEVYTKYANKINKAVEKFIAKDAENTKAALFEYGVLKSSKTGYVAENLALSEKESMSEAVLNRQMNAIAANYIINNIELHKLIYSDPYQYKDELKRIKNFNSPRQAIINGSKKMNAAFNKVWNKGYSGIGVTNFTRDYFRTATLEDVISTSDLKDYGEYEETDGGGIISFKSYRNFRIRAGEWNDDEEMQHMYDVAYEKIEKGRTLSDKQKIEKGLVLTDLEAAIFAKGNPNIKSAYTPIKPIVSGNKGNGKSYNDIMLDKFALYPMSFRVMHQLNAKSNAIKQYDKMQAEDIDYVVFGTGRKVGAEALNPIYNEDGSFNNNSYEGIVNVPFGIISIQSEVPSKDNNLVTRGSQITKLATMDYMEAGVPVDFNPDGKFEERFKEWGKLKTEEAKEAASPIYKEMRNNQMLLEEIMQEGYDQLLKEMGISESIVNKKKEFKITNFEKAAKTLREEIMKREVNDNINDALTGFLNGEAVLEATPAYQQVRNILYSIADKRVISPKMPGGQKVQIPSTFLEENRLKAEGKSGKVFSASDDLLKFYKNEKGERVCEIMVGRWFKTDMSDEALLKYLNTTPEGQKVLAGVAFRIPTQKQNSIDVFRIKKFLPREFGDSVVIPSQLVKKAGSDFDIDKLSIYFKNVLVNAKGEPKIVPFFGYGEQAKKKISEWLITNELETLFDVNKEDPEAIENLSVQDDEKDLADIDKHYKKSLENAYIESLENLISHPSNFDRLIAPNSADQLKKLSKKITNKLGFESFDYSSTSNMLSRRFMSRMRHAFVTGKYAIGIAAVNQTSHSLNQRQPIYIDINRFDELNDVDKYWLTKGTGKREDINIRFDEFNRIEIDGKMVPTLSMIRNSERSEKYPKGQDISDINGQFIDGYVDISKGPWIMELGATPNVASTWLFLVKMGVPIDSVAFFMNQPIIRDYLRSIESAGYSYLFMEDFVNNIYESPKYKVEGSANLKTIPSNTELFDMVGKSDLNSAEKLTQKFILGEFLKYAKLAEQTFNVTQGSNFDTATFNDPSLVFKKEMQLIKARKSVISSVDELLKNSFIGKLRGKIIDIQGALGTMLTSENPEVSDVIHTVLMDYIDLPDREFVQVARKVTNDLFDWAVQVNTKLNTQVQNILLSKDNAAKQINDFVKSVAKDDTHDLYNNLIIKSLIPKFADREDSRKPNNLKIKNKDNKIYDQNQMIYAFQELREYLKAENSPLYGKIIRLAILQSGLSNSPISFTSLIPYEDFKKIYNDTLSTLETTEGLANFAKLNVFQRNNWNDNDLVPYRKGKLKFNPMFMSSYYSELSFGSKDVLTAGIKSGKIPQVIKLYSKSAQANSDIIVYSWEVGTSKEKKKMRAEGDFSFIKKGLFKKVYSGSDPMIYPDKRGNPQYIYKMINAWGDSFRANEFYNVAKASVINNGFEKVVDKKGESIEASDETIIAYFEGVEVGQPTKDATPPVPAQPAEPSENPKIKEIKDKIELFETNVQNGVAGPDDFKTLDYLYKELGKLIKSIC